MKSLKASLSVFSYLFIVFFMFLISSFSSFLVHARLLDPIDMPTPGSSSEKFEIRQSIRDDLEDMDSQIDIGEIFTITIGVVNHLDRGAALLLKSTLNEKLKFHKAYLYSGNRDGTGNCQANGQEVSCGVALLKKSVIMVYIEAYAVSSGSFTNTVSLYDLHDLGSDGMLPAATDEDQIVVSSSVRQLPQEEERIYSLCRNNASVFTALGCVPLLVDGPIGMVVFFLVVLGAISGGLGMVLIIYGGYIIMTSLGDPRRLQAGKELVVATLSALGMVVFSVLLLRLIASDILNVF